MRKSEIKKLTSFFFEIGNLRKVLRAHQQMLLSYDLTDTIASHSFRVALIGYFLAKELKANADKVMKMCLLHDLEEARSMDHHWVSKRYVKIFEDEIRKEQLKDLPHSKELVELSREYQERKTLEAKIAKDADTLDQILLLREYAWQGNKEAAEWLRGKRKVGKKRKSTYLQMLSTQLAKEIAKEIKRQTPSFWWENLWTPKMRGEI